MVEEELLEGESWTTDMAPTTPTMVMIQMMTASTKPTMPQILPAFVLPFGPKVREERTDITMARMPRMMDTRGTQQNTMAKMPRTRGPTPVGLPEG